jgi:hypothetical protein
MTRPFVVAASRSGASRSGWCPAGASDALRDKFLTVAATHAALLLAQGAGWFAAIGVGQGVVAVRDPRPATARNGGFVRASRPRSGTTYDPLIRSTSSSRYSRTA